MMFLVLQPNGVVKSSASFLATFAGYKQMLYLLHSVEEMNGYICSKWPKANSVLWFYEIIVMNVASVRAE